MWRVCVDVKVRGYLNKENIMKLPRGRRGSVCSQPCCWRCRSSPRVVYHSHNSQVKSNKAKASKLRARSSPAAADRRVRLRVRFLWSGMNLLFRDARVFLCPTKGGGGSCFRKWYGRFLEVSHILFFFLLELNERKKARGLNGESNEMGWGSRGNKDGEGGSLVRGGGTKKALGAAGLKPSLVPPSQDDNEMQETF